MKLSKPIVSMQPYCVHATMFYLCNHVLSMQPYLVYATMCCLCNHVLSMQTCFVYATMCCPCNHVLSMQPCFVYATMFRLRNHVLSMQPYFAIVLFAGGEIINHASTKYKNGNISSTSLRRGDDLGAHLQFMLVTVNGWTKIFCFPFFVMW